VANIRIKRFSAGHHKKDRAEHDKSAMTVIEKKLDSTPRIDRRQHFRRVDDLIKSEKADREKPEDRNRTENAADARRAARLK